jgi:CheY-like chemotaxis protein
MAYFRATKLQNVPGLRIISEVSDGIEAVDQAQELQPDLVVLDIGLPKLNGIEAARRIRDSVPNSRVLFFSEIRAWDIVEEALRSGMGYLLKSDADSELLSAVEAVLEDRQFLSSTLAGRNLDAKDQRIPKPQVQQLSAPMPPHNMQSRHEVQFYEDDASFVDGFVRLIQAVLSVGNIAIVIASESHRADILRKLKAYGVDTDLAMKQGTYVAVDASEALSSLMVKDMPDPRRCAKVVNDLVVRARENGNRDHARLAILGECAPTLLLRGNQEGAVRLEHLWDEITRNYQADTLCGYLRHTLLQEENSLVFQRICAEHSAIHGRQLGY